jgi:UDP-N-acetylmuramate: L-alanyl-gamma-D-glutamyl-meso-diaminopimelate ligase
MKVHFIAIGGSAMHNLAIALKNKGYLVSGSDDEIFEPSKSRLQVNGLLPETEGWHPERITDDIDAIILGMHARKDNPELQKAKDLGLKIFSYPEYIYEQTKNKQRVVVGGSHGKTSITAMILHVLNYANIKCDYMVGAQLEGFDCMVNLTENNNIAVIEGDEYLSSPDDLRPKFHLYHPNIAIINGIAWDHINVFPTFENYVEQFSIFIDKIEPNGTLLYNSTDAEVVKLVENKQVNQEKIAYGVHSYQIRDGVTYLQSEKGETAIKIFGEHNLQNLSAAKLACNKLNVSDEVFYEAIQSFAGASKRLEPVVITPKSVFYKDFAHAPSKLKATTKALKEQFPERALVACLELHTFSSLNKAFLSEYHGCMQDADVALVYFNPKTIAHKKLEPLTISDVKMAFSRNDILVMNSSEDVISFLRCQNWSNRNLLMMTSGNFDGIDFTKLGKELFKVR